MQAVWLKAPVLHHDCVLLLLTRARSFMLFSRSVLSDSATPWTVAARLLCPWYSPGKNTGEGCHFLLQGVFQPRDRTPECRRNLYHWATWKAGSDPSCGFMQKWKERLVLELFSYGDSVKKKPSTFLDANFIIKRNRIQDLNTTSFSLSPSFPPLTPHPTPIHLDVCCNHLLIYFFHKH